MDTIHFLKGNEAIAEAAVRSGCRFFAGYPITPQNEIPEYLSHRLFEVGGTFIQGESEVASINMIYGASCTGTRCMTSSSGCGIALKTEGFGYLTGANLPCVVIDMARGGPGLGSILPAQQDYFYATKAISNGGARAFVLAPGDLQEAVDMTYEAFDIADRYRCVVMVLCDGVIGNMMAGVKLPRMRDLSELPDKSDWVITKRNADGSMRMITSCYVPISLVEQQNIHMAQMYDAWRSGEARWESFRMDDAEVVLAAYGTSSGIARSVVRTLRAEGIRAGLLRPKTLFPFPEQAFRTLTPDRVKQVICLEMSIPGQMVEDVRAYVDGRIPVCHWGRSGGMLMKPEETLAAVRELLR